MYSTDLPLGAVRILNLVNDHVSVCSRFVTEKVPQILSCSEVSCFTNFEQKGIHVGVYCLFLSLAVLCVKPESKTGNKNGLRFVIDVERFQFAFAISLCIVGVLLHAVYQTVQISLYFCEIQEKDPLIRLV